MRPLFFKKDDPKDNSDSPVKIDEKSRPAEKDWKGKDKEDEGRKGGKK